MILLGTRWFGIIVWREAVEHRVNDRLRLAHTRCVSEDDGQKVLRAQRLEAKLAGGSHRGRPTDAPEQRDLSESVSLAKSRDLEVHDRDEESARSPERIFVLGRKDPIVLPQNSAEIFMLMRMRDEAHRFAITYQQKDLRKSRVRSALEDIPGVGQTRRKMLLRHFGSLKRVSEATIEELAEVVGPSVAERVHAALHGHSEEEEEDPVREASLADAGDASEEKTSEKSTEGGSPVGSP